MTKVYLGIGGNLGSRLKNIDQAISLIAAKISMPLKTSSVYMSEPWGFDHAKYFTNAVIELETDLSAYDLLEKIAEIELIMKRVRSKIGYEGRSMDIDILFFGDMIINTENLRIPHPKIADRLFVLMPMHEISSDFYHIGLHKTIIELLSECKDLGKIRKLNYGT